MEKVKELYAEAIIICENLKTALEGRMDVAIIGVLTSMASALDNNKDNQKAYHRAQVGPVVVNVLSEMIESPAVCERALQVDKRHISILSIWVIFLHVIHLLFYRSNFKRLPLLHLPATPTPSYTIVLQSYTRTYTNYHSLLLQQLPNTMEMSIFIDQILAYLCRYSDENKMSASLENAKAIGIANGSEAIVLALQKHVRY